MADQGCVVLTAQNLTDGTVTVTPAATPASGVARISYKRQVLNKEKQFEEPRVATVSGNDLVVTLDAKDRVGRMVCWVSYE